MAFVEDFAPFFADFGVTATPETGASFTVIFDKDYLAALGVVASSNPVCIAPSADIDSREIGDESVLTISGMPTATDDGDYVVAGQPKPDGTGVTVLELRRSC